VALDQGRLPLATQAVDHATEAEQLLPENPFSSALNAWTRLVAMHLATEVDETQAIDFRRECEEILGSLQGRDRAFAVPAIRGYFCELTNAPEAEDVIFEAEDDDCWMANRAAFFYRIGRMEVAGESHLNDVEDMALAAIARLTILAAQGREEEAMEGYERVIRVHTSSFVRAGAVQIPFILGNSDKARSDARRFLESGNVPDAPFYLARTRLSYFAGELSARRILNQVRGSRLGENYAHYAIALTCLSSNAERAREHFELCLASGQFWTPEYHMSKALLAQLPQLRGNDLQQDP
jgi:hypothetical protein